MAEYGERVRIVGDHPHRGSSGSVVIGGAVKFKDDGPVMLRVELDQGDHPGQECFAGAENLRLLSRSEDPRSRPRYPERCGGRATA